MQVAEGDLVASRIVGRGAHEGELIEIHHESRGRDRRLCRPSHPGREDRRVLVGGRRRPHPAAGGGLPGGPRLSRRHLE